MNRREFLRASGAGCLALAGAKPLCAKAPPAGGTIMTVAGPISPAELGSTLSHEHVLVDFIGADKVSRERYDAGEAFDVALPHLQRAREWADGIEGTGIRPGFIKTGVDAGPVSAIDRKLVQAAARTHARTGLTIASHTGDTRAALEQFDILDREHVRPEAFIWVHAQSDWELESRVEAARKGAWVEIDNIDVSTVPQCVERVTALKQRGVLNRLLVSHDAGWYRPGEPKGGAFRGFDTAYTAFVPALRGAGWTADEIGQLLVSNPAAAFTIRGRTRV